MSKLQIIANVINQKGTPSLYTDVFANRPAYGQNGRLFVSTDTAQIFEDTGTSWILISDAGSGSSNLEQITTNGNTTDRGIIITANGLQTNQLNIPSLTSGSILFADGSGLVQQDNINLYWDDTNNRLGIQTNTPGAPLDIHNGLANTTTVQVNNVANSNAYIGFQKNNTGYWRIGNTAAANSFDILNNSLANTALSIDVATNAVTITNLVSALNFQNSTGNNILNQSNGNTNIGFSADQGYKLAINGTSLFNNSIYNNVSNAYSGGASYSIFTNNTLTIATAPTAGNSIASANNAITTNFNAALTIANSTPICNTASTLLYGASNIIGFTQNGTAKRALASVYATTANSISGAGQISDLAGILITGAYANAGLTNYATITNYYGIIINPSDEYPNKPTISNKYGLVQLGANDFNYFQGNVGISTGNVNAGYTLDVNGTARINLNQNSSTWIKVQNSNAGAGAAAGLLMTNDGGDLGAISLLSSGNNPANALFIRTLSTNSLVLGTNNTERMRITSGGNVLIGTTTDAGYRLDINATARIQGALTGTSATFSQSLTSTNSVQVQNINTAYNAQLRLTTSQDWLIQSVGSSDANYANGLRIYDNTNGVSKLILTGGTNSSALNLNATTVSSNGNAVIRFQQDISNKWQIQYDFNSATFNFYNFNTSQNALSFNSSSAASFTGEISIGNSVSASVLNTVTNKIKIVVNGTTYYLLASTSSL
jgi:hypothetical protein